MHETLSTVILHRDKIVKNIKEPLIEADWWKEGFLDRRVGALTEGSGHVKGLL